MALLSWLSNFVLGYVGITASLYMASMASSRAGFFARLLASYISLIVCALYGVAASIVLRLAGHPQIAQWATARSFKYLMAATTGVTFDIQDPRGTLATLRPAVFIGNHQTELDVLMLGCMFPKYCSVTAKSSLRRVPFLGWFMSLSGSIFIDRKNTKDARDAMRGAADEIRQSRQSVYMFPEGTRSYAPEPELLPFKKGAFHLAVQAGVPIVPCVVANYSHILNVKNMTFRSGRVPVKVLDPIPTTGLKPEDVDELTRTTRDLMLREMINLTAQARGEPIPVAAVAAVAADQNGVAAKASGVDAAAKPSS